MSDKYITGHKPKETYAQMVSRINANCFFMREGGQEAKPVKKQKRKRKKDLKANLEVLMGVVKGDRKLVSTEDGSFGYKKTSTGWSVIGLEAGSEEHEVNVDFSACSCPDNRFRGNECKHMKAMKHATAS